MIPSGKCFVAGPRGYLALEAPFEPMKKMTALGVFSGFYERLQVYDADGKVWRVKEVQSGVKKSWWRVLLANSVYNPSLDIRFVWSEPQAYALDDLKKVYAAAVDLDDDDLTQFVEAAELKAKIVTAGSFDDLVRVYRWMQTDHTA